MNYLYREKYCLELRWDRLTYRNDTTIVLDNARFCGPALHDAIHLEAPDHIDLDLSSQLIVVHGVYYIVRLAWEGVEYQPDDSIRLVNATLENLHLKTVHKFEEGDYLIINTEKHEESTHAYYLHYPSQVVRSNEEPHRYRK